MSNYKKNSEQEVTKAAETDKNLSLWFDITNDNISKAVVLTKNSKYLATPNANVEK